MEVYEKKNYLFVRTVYILFSYLDIDEDIEISNSINSLLTTKVLETKVLATDFEIYDYDEYLDLVENLKKL
jgi:hypothetical protein